MGKKRPHSDSTRRRTNRVEPSTRRRDHPNSPPSAFHFIKNRRIAATLAVFFVVTSAVVYRHFKPSHSSSPDFNLINLVKTNVNYEEIINENSRVSKNVTHRHFKNAVLGYITPWNAAGYDMAKKFNSKFTHLSPVWYDIKSQGTELILEGRHNADAGWLSELRQKGNAKILPRFVLEAAPTYLLGKNNQREKAIDLIVAECKDMDYDGIVLESWSRWAAYGIFHDPALRKMAFQFVKQLGDVLHNMRSPRNGQQLQLVYVIGPPNSEKLQAHEFGPQDLHTLSDYVDGFSLMTYDYSSSYAPGPNAPLPWVHSTIELLSASNKSLASKILVGINFYGNDFVLTEGGGAQALIGRDYLSLLDQYKPMIKWHKESAEHFFSYLDDQHRQHIVFYPTLLSIAKRMDEAHSWGAGISIWEIGQGLDYFLNLL